ncbi:MAG: insulinase family protein [Bryobacteraceae bacterium]|nr:insulinase family protein [Bryobacteraceae bacterium]
MKLLPITCMLTSVCLAQAPAARQATPAMPMPAGLKYPPLKPVVIPEPAVVKLSNGMRVYLLENHELPLVSGVALVRTGNLFDPADKRGLADMTGTVMRSGGAKSKSGEQIDLELENIAASVESSIGETSGSVSFSSLRENAGRVLELMRDIMQDPEFRADKVDLAKRQYRGAISRRNDEASDIAGREFASIVYGRDNPYGWQIEYEHIDRIRREDLQAFHQRYFFPANVMLAVYGDFDTAAMKQQLEKIFGEWKAQQPPVPPFPKPPDAFSPGVYLAVKPDVTQSFLQLGHWGGTLRDPDYPALEVAANILGSGFSSRLVNRVRTQLGYAYNVGAAWGANYNHRGLFQISGSTKSATTVETLQVIREEVEKMRALEVTPRELETAKQTILNGFVFNFDSPSKTLSRLLQYEYHGYPKDFLFQYQKAVAAVTRADVLRVAKQYWSPDKLTILAVGNPKEFGKPLNTLGPVRAIDLTIPEPPRETKATPDSLKQGAALRERMREAMGSLAKLSAVRDLSRSVEMAVAGGPAPGMKIRQRTLLLRPNILRQEQELPFGKVIVYSDGQTGWLSAPQGMQPMSPPVLEQVRGEMFRTLPWLLSEEGLQANLVGPGAIEISSAAGAARLEIDDLSGLPKRMIYSAPGASAAPDARIVETFSDWRDVGGIQLPFAITVEQGGKKFGDMTVSELRINSDLKAEELAKKP